MIIRCFEDANNHTILTNFMNKLKNTELLTFLYMLRSFKPGFITVSTENYRGMAHIKIRFSKYHVKKQ